MRFKVFFLSVFCFLCVQNILLADPALESMQQSLRQLQQSMEELKATVQSQNEVIRQQAVRIDALERGGANLQQPGAMPAPVSVSGPAVAGPAGFNPEIGVTGTVQTKLTQDKSDTDGNDAVALKELELNFASAVDPFSRLDAIISFNDHLESQNADIEEAYYTRWGLPLGFTGQIGKFRAKIGKQNLEHLHQLETADYPLVIKDFFGDSGLASSGVRLQNYIPNPWDQPVEITGEVLRGNNGNSFSGISRRPIFNTHIRTFFDITQDSNLEFGWTTLFGDENRGMLPGGQDRYGVKVYGGDATWVWNLPEGKRLKFQNELYFENRSSLVHANKNPWGFYNLLDYKFSPRMSAGVRFDYVQPLDVQGQHLQTTGVSPYLTFYQSEFADFKLQYSRLDPAAAGSKSDNAVYLAVDFLIGAHKHPVQ